MPMTAQLILTISRGETPLASGQAEIDLATARWLVERMTALLTEQPDRTRLVRLHKIGGGQIVDLAVLPPRRDSFLLLHE